MGRLLLILGLLSGCVFAGVFPAQAQRCTGGISMFGYGEAWTESTAQQKAKDDAINGCQYQGGTGSNAYVVDSGWIGGEQYPAWASAKCCCVGI